MQVTKEKINTLITEFETIKDSITLSEKNLKAFNFKKKEDREFYSYVNGNGGYYIKFLNYLVKKLQPENVLELGSWSGLSTVAMYDGLPETSHFYTVDLVKDQRYCPEHMFNDPRVTFLFGDVCSYDVVHKIDKNIDILFTDTLHFNYQIEDEFEIYQHLLSDTAIVAIDDIHSNDKGLFFENINYEKWDLTELCHGSGWGLFLFTRKAPLQKEEKNTNILLSIIRVWERKYMRIYTQQNMQTSAGQKIKNILKRNHTLYKTYTTIYNKSHAILKSKKVLNHNLKGRL